MYKIIATKNIDKATYSYDDFNAIRYAETAGNDVSFPNNSVTAISGADVNAQIADGTIDIADCAFKEPLHKSVYYVFRKTLGGKYFPLHVSMMPKTMANLLKGSKRFGSMAISRDVFGE